MQPLEQVARRLKGLIIKRQGMALGLWGEVGIGKTHAAITLMRESSSRGFAMHATASLADLTRALPKPAKLPVWAATLLEKLEGNEVLSLEQSVSAFAAVFSGIAPFILYLEDIHEASPERLEWIVAMAKVVTRLKGVALIVTSRSEPPKPFEAIRLEKLEFEAVKTLLEIEARSDLPLEALEWIHGKAAGNPLFTVEYFRLLARLGFVWNDGQQWRWRKPEQDVIPLTVEALLEQTLRDAANTPELEAVLGAKAVLGLDCTEAIWSKVAALEFQEFRKAKQVLERNGVLFQSEFVHPLYREMTFKYISKTRLTEFARTAIKALQDTPEKAHQLIEIADLESTEALSILIGAALRLETRGDVVAAAHIRVQALNYANGDTRNELALEAARVLIDSPDTTQALKVLEEVSVSLNTGYQNTALVLMAEVYARANERIRMNATIEQLPQDYRNGFTWFAKYIHVLFDSNDYNAVIEYWKQHPEHHLASGGLTMYHVAYAQIDQGNLDVAQTLINHFLERPNLNPEDQTHGLDILATIAFYQGNYQEAERLFTQLLNTCNRKNIRNYSNYLRNRAVNRLQLGQYEQSLPDFEESIWLDFERGMPVVCAQTKIMMSAVYLETGKFEQVEQVLLEALEVLKPLPAQAFLIYGLVGLALLYLRWQPAHGALLAQKYALEGLRIAQSLATPVLQANAYLSCSEVQTQTGNPQLGLDYAEQSLSLAKQIDFSEASMNAHLARASALYELGRKAEALRDLQAAESICLETGLILELQKTLLEIDRLNNDLNGAKQRLAWFESNGFVMAANMARKYFPDLELVKTTVTFESQKTSCLELLGSLQITFEHKPQTIRGQKRQELLVLLLEARVTGKSELTRLELFDALYPNDPEDRASSSLKELIRGTRANLGADAIQTTQNGYVLGSVTSDVEEFFKTGDSSLWRGAYFQGLEVSGSENVRESLELALQHCIQKLLETDAKEAARVSRFLLEMNLYNLEHLRLCVLAFKASENYKTLGRVYTDARERLADLGEILPERWQDFLELQIPA
jgi:tetratricopeptide (TPR) repeat protein